MWDLPGPGLEPVSPALAGGFLTTVPPGKPRSTVPLRINLLLQYLCATKIINPIEEWLLAGGIDRRQHVTLAGPPGNRGGGCFSVLRTVCASLYTGSAAGGGAETRQIWVEIPALPISSCGK